MEQLEKYFDTAFGAPDGIKKLRELILTLAMQGKLVPQLPKENSASQLLELITKEKASYWKSNKTKPLGPFDEIDSENVPYNVPSGWKWVRLGEVILSITGGGTPSKNNAEYWRGSIPWASVKDLNVDTYLEKTIDSISEKAIKESSTNLIPKGSIIVCTRMGLGKIAINTIDLTINQDLKALKLSKYIDEIFFINKFKEYKIVGKGVTVHGIRQDELLNFLFPLPPLEEQKRIVVRINELYLRCDELEKLRNERDQKRLAVHTAAISKMLDAPDQETFDDAWLFITHYFGDLYTVRENVAELRKSILQLAVMGKLVPQDPKDGTARELLTLIDKEKKKLLKEGKIKAFQELPRLVSSELPHEIPSSWEWVRLQSVIDVRDGTHDSPRDAIGRDTFPLITSKDFINGKIDFSKARYISANDHYEIAKRSKVEKYDILFSMIGGNIGNQVMVKDEIEFSIKNVALFKYYSKDLTYPIYIKHFLEHLAFDLQGKAAGGAQPFVSLGFLRNIAIPLPPAKEQIRIAKKIDQIMKLCDHLKKQIEIANTKSNELAVEITLHIKII